MAAATPRRAHWRGTCAFLTQHESFHECYHEWAWRWRWHAHESVCFFVWSVVVGTAWGCSMPMARPWTRPSSLRRIAAHCGTVRHSAAQCGTVRHSALRRNSATKAHCGTLRHTAAHCGTLRHISAHFGTLGTSMARPWAFNIPPARIASSLGLKCFNRYCVAVTWSAPVNARATVHEQRQAPAMRGF